MSDLAIYRKGPFGSSLTKSMFVSENTQLRVKVYEQKNAIQHSAELGNYFISQKKYETMLSFTVKPRDYIVSCAGTIGEIYRLPSNAEVGIINQALMRITLFDDSIADFFEISFHRALKTLSNLSNGTAIKNIPPFEILKPYEIMLPPINEQIRIISKINYIFKLMN